VSRSVVLLSLGASAPGDALVAGVEQLRAEGAAVHLISRTPPAPALAGLLDGHVAVGRPGGGAVRVSKLRVDPHRLPGAVQAVLRGRSRSLLRTADVVVAVDAAALPATWLAARLNRRAVAVNGLPAALSRLA
jgi:hypothetical protein